MAASRVTSTGPTLQTASTRIQSLAKKWPRDANSNCSKETFFCVLNIFIQFIAFERTMQICPQESIRQQAAVPVLGNRNLLVKEILAESDIKAKYGFMGACSNLLTLSRSPDPGLVVLHL